MTVELRKVALKTAYNTSPEETEELQVSTFPQTCPPLEPLVSQFKTRYSLHWQFFYLFFTLGIYNPLFLINNLIFLATHLINQEYNVCFRRESGMCAICFFPAIFNAIGAMPGMQSSFGLSIASDATALKSNPTTAICNTDYIIVSHFSRLWPSLSLAACLEMFWIIVSQSFARF